MAGSGGRWPGFLRGAAALLANGNRAGARVAPYADERWRRNNRALLTQCGLSSDDRREVVRTFGAAFVWLVLIAAIAVESAVLAPAVTGRPFVLDEAGSVLDQDGNPSVQGRSRSVVAPPSQLVWRHG